MVRLLARKVTLLVAIILAAYKGNVKHLSVVLRLLELNSRAKVLILFSDNRDNKRSILVSYEFRAFIYAELLLF